MEPEPCITLSIVEDSPSFARELREILELEAGIKVLTTCSTVASARIHLPKLSPDVVLVDLHMPDGDGAQLLADLIPSMPGTDFVVMTVFEDDENIQRAIRSGATGYLLKRSGMRGIIQAVRVVRAGGTPIDKEVLRRLLAFLREPPAYASVLPELSPQENRLLQELSKGATVKEASDMIGVTYASGRTYVRRVYAKLGVHNRMEAARKFLNLASPFHRKEIGKVNLDR